MAGLSAAEWRHSLRDAEEKRLTVPWKGPVTDYGATIVHWMRHRQPRYKGSYAGETERPSNSYIVDVSILVLSSE
jgi:polyadenylation factor subunit 2